MMKDKKAWIKYKQLPIYMRVALVYGLVSLVWNVLVLLAVIFLFFSGSP